MKPVADPDFDQALGIVVNHLIAQVGGLPPQVAVGFAEQALDRINGAGGVCQQVFFRLGAHQRAAAVGRKMHHRRHQDAPAQVVDGGWQPGFGMHVGYQRVGGAQVDADDDVGLLKGAGGEVDGDFGHRSGLRVAGGGLRVAGCGWQAATRQQNYGRTGRVARPMPRSGLLSLYRFLGPGPNYIKKKYAFVATGARLLRVSAGATKPVASRSTSVAAARLA